MIHTSRFRKTFALAALGAAALLLESNISRAENLEAIPGGDFRIVAADEVPDENLEGMPPRKVNVGTKSLYCVALEWNDSHAVTSSKCMSMARFVSQFYKRNSGGKLILEPHAGSLHTHMNASRKNINRGEKLALRKFKADYYIIPNVQSGRNHAGSKIAHLAQMDDGTATHEMGHVLGLGHSTGMDPTPYYDTGSIMNPASANSNLLTAPQYYFLGWFSPKETALYDGRANTTYVMKAPLNPSDIGYGVVIIPPAVMDNGGKHTDRFAFLSAPQSCMNGRQCVALHLTNGGGSQRVREITIGNTYVDYKFTGLEIQTSQGVEDQTVQVVVTAK